MLKNKQQLLFLQQSQSSRLLTVSAKFNLFAHRFDYYRLVLDYIMASCSTSGIYCHSAACPESRHNACEVVSSHHRRSWQNLYVICYFTVYKRRPIWLFEKLFVQKIHSDIAGQIFVMHKDASYLEQVQSH